MKVKRGLDVIADAWKIDENDVSEKFVQDAFESGTIAWKKVNGKKMLTGARLGFAEQGRWLVLDGDWPRTLSEKDFRRDYKPI